jgi:hypothetical protein
MRALTVNQPYADWIVSGKKRIENRTFPTNYTGPLVITSSAANPRGATGIPKERFGAALGIAHLLGCVHESNLEEFITENPEYEWIRGNEHAEGPWMWVFDENRDVFDVPIPCKGRLNIWNFTEPIPFDYSAESEN